MLELQSKKKGMTGSTNTNSFRGKPVTSALQVVRNCVGVGFVKNEKETSEKYGHTHCHAHTEVIIVSLRVAEGGWKHETRHKH